jgi:CheY-like chemotaxis protein
MTRNISIFIADDDEDDRKLFIDSVAEIDKDIICVTASDGQEAITYLTDEHNARPDYIFLDLRMPRMGGRKCLEEIKKDTRLSQIPVFIFTTSREVQDSTELKKMGAAHFISKPDDPNDVYYLLSVVLSGEWDQAQNS